MAGRGRGPLPARAANLTKAGPRLPSPAGAPTAGVHTRPVYTRVHARAPLTQHGTRVERRTGRLPGNACLPHPRSVTRVHSPSSHCAHRLHTQAPALQPACRGISRPLGCGAGQRGLPRGESAPPTCSLSVGWARHPAPGPQPWPDLPAAGCAHGASAGLPGRGWAQGGPPLPAASPHPLCFLSAQKRVLPAVGAASWVCKEAQAWGVGNWEACLPGEGPLSCLPHDQSHR